MSICTWKECQNTAASPQLDKNGHEWANLCPKHVKEFDDATGSLNAGRVLRAWALAGKEHHARGKMADDIARVCGALSELARKRG